MKGSGSTGQTRTRSEPEVGAQPRIPLPRGSLRVGGISKGNAKPAFRSNRAERRPPVSSGAHVSKAGAVGARSPRHIERRGASEPRPCSRDRAGPFHFVRRECLRTSRRGGAHLASRASTPRHRARRRSCRTSLVNLPFSNISDTRHDAMAARMDMDVHALASATGQNESWKHGASVLWCAWIEAWSLTGSPRGPFGGVQVRT